MTALSHPAKDSFGHAWVMWPLFSNGYAQGSGMFWVGSLTVPSDFQSPGMNGGRGSS